MAEKRPEPLLGELCRADDKKDAIHIAIVPVIAGGDLWAGAMLKFAPDSQEIVIECRTRKFAVGIADPFFAARSIREGERFWMCLYPYTITSLRHEWTHPAFAEPTVENTKLKNDRIRQVTAALMADEKWLRGFANEVEITYEELIKAAHEFLDRGEYHTLPFDTPNFDGVTVRKFWENFQAVTGRQVDRKAQEEMFFSCSC